MNLTEVEKAAVLLIALGPQRAQRILDRLGATNLVPIIDAMQRMGQIVPEIRRAVLREVDQLLTDRAAGRVSGVEKPPSEAADERIDFFAQLGPYLPDRIDWDADDSNPGTAPEDGS